jgi:hypothetical protein
VSTVKSWHETFYTYIWLFKVGRGLAVCIRLPHNVGILYDLGRDDTFSPTDFIAKNIAPKLATYNGERIAQCVMSHPHADHIAEVENVISHDQRKPLLYSSLITCPHDKLEIEKLDFRRIENEDNEALIRAYKTSYEGRTPPLQTIRSIVPCTVPNVEYGIYYMVPPSVTKIHPSNDQDYGNGVSIVLYLRHGNQSVLIPGDVTPQVCKDILNCGDTVERRYTRFSARSADDGDSYERNSNQPKLGDLLRTRGLSVLVAPHHGLESGYSPELFGAIKGGKPMINVIVEKRHLSESDGSVHPNYSSRDGATGLSVDIEGKREARYSVSTRNGQHILMVLKGTDAAPQILLREDPMQLLGIE